MTAVLDQLHRDHVHIVRLLDFVEAEVAKAGGDGHPDLYLLRDVMHYMTRYPDVYHHPREDRIFALLRGCEGVDIAELDAVLAEHESLTETGKAFLDAVEALLRDRGMLVAEFKTLADGYTKLQRRHLNREEGSLFKQARAKLTAEQWDEIQATFVMKDDPVFGAGLRTEYERLVQELEFA
jgi:hemerythrin-like domain-containing protein